MYTRNRPTQNYARNSGTPQSQGSYQSSNFNTQGSYQASQSAPTQQSNYKPVNIQPNFKSQQSQQQTNPPSPATQTAGSPRLLPTMAPTQMKSSMSQQQGQPQMAQLQQQQQQQPQQQQQQQQQSSISSMQQQMSSPAPLPQRLKPILKQSSANVQSVPMNLSQSVSMTQSQPCVPSPVPAPTSTNNNSDIKDDEQSDKTDELQDAQPRWRRKIPGFKVNKKLKRLRMNQRLRKTLQPKNAIMVLNEMKAGVQFTFPETQGPMPNSLYLVHAELDGKTYVGQGLSKPLARQNAAENALKALLLEKMTAASMKARIDAESDGQPNSSSMDVIKEENNDDSHVMDTNTEDEIPWSSLASFALYKLFLEWHNQGTSVPVPRPGLSAIKGIKKDNSTVPKPPVEKELPPNPTNIHPVMLLNQMKPGLIYVELNRVGNPPNTMFTLAVKVDGVEYSGTAKNKKDAKKAAAKAALLALYDLTYPEDTTKQENMIIE